MALYDYIVACNAHDLNKFRPFEVAGKRVGWVRRDLVEHLDRWPAVFDLADDKVALHDAIGDADARTSALAKACDALAAEDLVPQSRSEQFAVVAGYGEPPLLRLDRGWVPAFGVTAFGVHVNGYVATPGGPELWLGLRGPHNIVDPGKLDNMVAGGLPAGLTLEENVVKEAHEEASVPEALARQARPAGAVTYTVEVPQGLRHDMLFIYDLRLPEDFRPETQDGEHTGFRRVPAAEALRMVDETSDFKFNVNLVIIDFAIRHGVLTPAHPDYLRLLRGLRTWD